MAKVGHAVAKTRLARAGKHHGKAGRGVKHSGRFDLGKLSGALAGGIPFVGGGAQELIRQATHGGGGGGGRRRRMHVTNVKALRRSMRRVQGFAKLARRVMTFTHTHKMKKRRRR